MSDEIERIQPLQPTAWARIVRRRTDDERPKKHALHEEPEEEEGEGEDEGGDEHPHVDIRV